MSTVICCPRCQRRLQLPSALEGRAVRCPVCSEIFRGVAPRALSAASSPISQQTGQTAPTEPFSWDEDKAFFEEIAAVPSHGQTGPVPHHGRVILTFAILGLLTPGLGLIFGVLAWVLGSYDLEKIRHGQCASEGEGLAVVGRLLGIVATLFHLLLLVLLLAFFFPPGIVP